MASPVIHFEFPWIMGSLRKDITLNAAVKKTSADYGSTCSTLLTSFVSIPAAVKLYNIYSQPSWRIITWGVHVASCNMNRALTNPLQGATTQSASLSGLVRCYNVRGTKSTAWPEMWHGLERRCVGTLWVFHKHLQHWWIIFRNVCVASHNTSIRKIFKPVFFTEVLRRITLFCIYLYRRTRRVFVCLYTRTCRVLCSSVHKNTREILCWVLCLSP
jgi:hypothetical protein